LRTAGPLAGLALLVVALASPSSAAARSSWHTYANAAGSRSYLLDVPADLPPHPALFVFLHGCNQTPAGVADGGGWARLAAQQRFVAVFPQEQTLPSDTILKACWAWEQAANQQRGSGEPSIIAGITEQVTAAEHVDPRQIYIAGFSAGGYMANIMAVTYPDIYAAAAIVAGGPYGTGTDSTPDVTGQQIVTEMGPRKRAVPVIVIQATNDNINPYPAGFAAVQQWLDAYDLIDDAQENDSVSHVPSSITIEPALAVPSPGQPTACDVLAPCAGGILGLRSYPYTIAHYLDPQGRPLLDFVTIYGANHDYTGAAGATGTFMDPTGPSATVAAFSFLSGQRR
jgi:poly(hydroxyalkanoate) depolymerase family esterase